MNLLRLMYPIHFSDQCAQQHKQDFEQYYSIKCFNGHDLNYEGGTLTLQQLSLTRILALSLLKPEFFGRQSTVLMVLSRALTEKVPSSLNQRVKTYKNNSE